MSKSKDYPSGFARSLTHLEHLPFDTEVFGFPFFRLDPENGLEIDKDLATIRGLTKGRFGCDAKVMDGENKTVESLVRLGFREVCEQVTLQLETLETLNCDEVRLRMARLLATKAHLALNNKDEAVAILARNLAEDPSDQESLRLLNSIRPQN